MADPKPTDLAPSARHLPYGPSGTLLPNGPEFPATPPATDLAGLPWSRHIGSEWTTLEQRDAVREFLIRMFKKASPNYQSWAITERDYSPRSNLRLEAVLLVLNVAVVKNKIRYSIGTALEFHSEARHDLVKFRAVLVLGEAALAAEYAKL